MADRKQHKVIVMPDKLSGYFTEGTLVREACRKLGVAIEGVCGGKGSCGKCRVRIEEGRNSEYCIESSGSHVSDAGINEKKIIGKKQLAEGYRLSCMAKITGDICVFVPEESRIGKQAIRKGATKRKFDIKPVIKSYTAQLSPAVMEDSQGDWERLRAELRRSYRLDNLVIDYNVLQHLQKTIREDTWQVTAKIRNDDEVIALAAGVEGKAYGIAIDIGTTTVAGYLCELDTGRIVANDAMMNPQVVYGDDVMSRITYCAMNKDGLKTLNRTIIKALNELLGRVTARANIKRSNIAEATIVGNTCMHHLLLNLNPYYIGRAPFTPSIHESVDVKARELGLHIAPGAYVHVLPVVAGFVGADTVGVLIAEAPYKQDSIELIIDIGTNGELIMGNREAMVSTSCATGPAFEGAEIKHGMRAAPGAIEAIEIERQSLNVRFKVIGKEDWNTENPGIKAMGICGSGIIDGVAQLFLAGVIDHTGRFRKDLVSKHLRKTSDGWEFIIASADESATGQEIVICQQDIRNVQLAKAALYAGAKIMMRKLGVEKVDKVILAGAFGSYINKKSAAVIGMFPDCRTENIYEVGNAAGDGARMALLNTEKRAEASEMAQHLKYVELTVEPDFNKVFNEAIWFPHMHDVFSSLGQLPVPQP